MLLPQVLIFSSSNSINIADTVQLSLDGHADVKTWKQGVFRPGANTLESAISEIDKHEFVVIVLSGDDVIFSDEVILNAPRDDVIFELGLSIGKLGADRVFMLVDEESDPKIPKDLRGITYIPFRRREDGNLEAALAAPVTRIKNAIAQRLQTLENRGYPTVFWAAPHYLTDKNREGQKKLLLNGIKVVLPDEIVRRKSPNASESDENFVRMECTKAIKSSDFVVVDLDLYGLDTAWIIGFAEGRNIPIISISRDTIGLRKQRNVNIRLYNENFMHGWGGHAKLHSLAEDEAEAHFAGIKVCVVGPFGNDEAFESVRNSKLKSVVDELLLANESIKFPATNFPILYRTHHAAYLTGSAWK